MTSRKAQHFRPESAHEIYNTTNKEELLKGEYDSVVSPLGGINHTIHETPYGIYPQEDSVASLNRKKKKKY